jgi:cardiolipin synthase
VEVSVLYDSVGSFATPAEFLERLRAAGIRACEFNPVNPFVARMWRLNHRDHRKIVVVDGRVGFTGGINFHGVYRTGSMPFGSRRDMPTLDEGWRDTHLAIRGPAVRELQQLFVRSWRKQHCPPLPERALFPPLPAAGDRVVAIIGASPDAMMNRTYFALLSAIRYAERSVYITAAYFAPDENTITALTGAAARGVDVRLLLPGFTDSWLAFHAGRSHYERLLAGGVRIYERRDALLHAKTAVVDGVWSSIGSSNVDWRSFTHNDEVAAAVLDAEFGAEMDATFFRDLAAADEVRIEAWRERGAGARFAEWFARRWEFWI